MPRKPRLHVPGGLYHVILCGNSRQVIFFDDDDRHRWESLLAEGLSRYGHRVHAYCWMTNHVHMAVQCRLEPVSRLMCFDASQYARSTNRKMQRSGHLFERRHRLVLVQADCYLKTLVRYIHQNPLRARMVEDLSAYRWSSHRAYVGKTKPDWLTIDWVLSMFGDSVAIAQRQYCEFVRQDCDDPQTRLFKTGGEADSRLLGDDEFGTTVAEATAQLPSSQSLDDIVARICVQYGVKEAELASKFRVRRNARIRAEIAQLAIDANSVTLAAVARRFNRSESVLSRSLARLRTVGK